MATFEDRHPLLRPTPSGPLARELGETLSVRGADREKRLLDSDQLAAVVGLMPPEELFFTLREMSEENIPAVLSCARPAQVQFLLDLELWRKDRLRTDRVESWLPRLVSSGPDALVRWLDGLAPETWTLLLGAVAKVLVQDEENDPFQDGPGRSPFTLDGVNHVATTEKMEPLVRELLICLRGQDPLGYQRLIEALSRDVDSELEEHCQEERTRRLGERGFPSWEEAYEVYARLKATELEQLPERPVAPPIGDEDAAEVAPRYPLTSACEVPECFLSALKDIGADANGEAFRAELAYLTNKVLVADGLDLDDLESFRRALRKVAAYVSIGLEVLCAGDGDKAARALSHHWLQHIFRVGWTRVKALQTEARHFLDKGWPAGKMERLLFLDSPLPEILDGVLRRTPLWHVGDTESAPLREFRTLHEVYQAEKALRKSDLLGRYLLSVISFQLKDLREASARLDLDNLKGSTVFLTALLNSALDRNFQFAPVDRKAARRGLTRIWERDHPPRRVRPGLADSALEWSKVVSPASADEEAYLREFVSDTFRLLEEEFGHLAEDETPDPRFTKGLWIE